MDDDAAELFPLPTLLVILAFVFIMFAAFSDSVNKFRNALATLSLDVFLQFCKSLINCGSMAIVGSLLLLPLPLNNRPPPLLVLIDIPPPLPLRILLVVVDVDANSRSCC